MLNLNKSLALASAFVDQACFAIANFTINLILARILAQTDYGAFSIAFSIYTLGLILFTGMVVEPMMVFGSGRYSRQLRDYLAILRRHYWLKVWPLVTLLLLVIAILYPNRDVRQVILLLAVGSGPLLYQLMQRRICYLLRRPWLAAAGGLVYLISISIISFGWSRVGGFTAQSGVVILGASATIGVLAITGFIVRIPHQPNHAATPPLNQTQIAREHLSYARWALLTNLFNWIPANIYFIILPIITCEQDAARLRATLNLLMPVVQFQFALAPLLLPWLVRRVKRPDFPKIVNRLALAMCIPSLGWLGILGWKGTELQNLFYAGNYNETPALLIGFGLSAVLSALVLVLSASLRARERPDLVTRGYLTATIACVVFGVPATHAFGLAGVAAGFALSAFANLVVIFYHSSKPLLPQETATQSPSKIANEIN